MSDTTNVAIISLMGVVFTAAIALINSAITSWVNGKINKEIKLCEIAANKEIKKQEYEQAWKSRLFQKRFDVFAHFEETVYPLFSLRRSKDDGLYFFTIFANPDGFLAYYQAIQDLEFSSYWLSKQTQEAFQDFSAEILYAYQQVMDEREKRAEPESDIRSILIEVGKLRHEALQIKAHEFAIRLHTDYKELGDMDAFLDEKHNSALTALEKLIKHKAEHMPDNSSIKPGNGNE